MAYYGVRRKSPPLSGRPEKRREEGKRRIQAPYKMAPKDNALVHGAYCRHIAKNRKGRDPLDAGSRQQADKDREKDGRQERKGGAEMRDSP